MPAECRQQRRQSHGRHAAAAPPARGRARVIFMAAPRSLVVKVTAGKDDPERCNQALTVAAAAAASGVAVSLWLTGEASWMALPDGCPDLALPHATPLPDLLGAVLGAGTVTLCTQCAARRDIGPDDVVSGVRIAGATTFVAEILADGAQALVY
jgi:predicted peroxiredoxin